uniref:MAM domain-containing protein n=1 Tax=Daphnia galeata TaxID=27404 RepID=A0A8J2RWR8_9CRUS|nr:unnamed protein product [Daphnia galeata]
MNSFLLFSALGLLLLFLIDEQTAHLVSCQNQECDEKVEATTVFELIRFDSDFENGKIDPWIEQSEFGVKWKIENNISPWEPENAAPYPPYGRNYLRVNRGAALSFGVAVLRSPTFTILPDNDVLFSFSFWIRSKWPQFTNLELYLGKNGNEGLLLNLYNYSDVSNRIWRSQTVSITDDSSSDLTILHLKFLCLAKAVGVLRLLRHGRCRRCGAPVDAVCTTVISSMTSTTPPSTTSIFTDASTSFQTESTSLTDFLTSTTMSTTSSDPSISSSTTTSTTATSSRTSTTPPSTTSIITTSTSSSYETELTTFPSTTSFTSTPAPTTSSSTTPVTTTSDPITPQLLLKKRQQRSNRHLPFEPTEILLGIALLIYKAIPKYLVGPWVGNVGKNWLDANSYCEEKDMILLSLETEDEDRLIYDHIKATTQKSDVSSSAEQEPEISWQLKSYILEMVEPVPESIDFSQEEGKILEYWKKIDAFKTSLKFSKGKPRYAFYDGPPFATGLPHYGHILAGTIKDIVTRPDMLIKMDFMLRGALAGIHMAFQLNMKLTKLLALKAQRML